MNKGTFNKITLIGRLGKDPEVFTTKTDKIWTKLSLATTDGWKDNEKTNWHNVAVFGKSAQYIADQAQKGSCVSVSGRVEYSQHDGKYYTQIIAEEVMVLKESSGRHAAANKIQEPEIIDNDLPY